MTPFSILGTASLVLMLAAAVVMDLRSRRIPNQLVLAGLVTALLLHGLALSSGRAPLAGASAWAPLTGLLAGAATLLPLHLLRACGAGDVKLMAAVGTFIGAPAVLSAALCTVLAGGVLSLLFMFGHGVAARTLGNVHVMLVSWLLRLRTGTGLRLDPLETTAVRLPYAVAIATGTVCALSGVLR